MQCLLYVFYILGIEYVLFMIFYILGIEYAVFMVFYILCMNAFYLAGDYNARVGKR